MALSADYQKLSVEGLITLYQLDATALGAGILYLHGHTNYEDNGLQKREIVFNGITYKPVAIDSDGLEQRGVWRAGQHHRLLVQPPA